MTKDEALDLALEALELHGKQYPHMVKGYCLDAITALREALAEQAAQQASGTEWLVCPTCAHQSPYTAVKAKTLAEEAELITKQARAALAQIKPAQQEPVARMDALKDAFFEGFTSVETYNDSRLNSPEEAWAKYKPPVIPPAAPVQEPAGRVVSASCDHAVIEWSKQTSAKGGGDPRNSWSWPIGGEDVYLAPPAAQRQWVGLTDEEIEKACVPLGAAMLSFTEVARAIEAKLKEKNNG